MRLISRITSLRSADSERDGARNMSLMGLVSRISPVQTAVCNCTRDEGGPFGIGNQLLISSHRKLLWSKATVVNVAEKPDQGVRQA